MLKADKDEDLGRMFELVSRIPDGLNKFMVLLEKHIEEVGLGQIEKLGSLNSADVSTCIEGIHKNLLTSSVW